MKWIKQKIFVEMSELLPDHLSSADANVENRFTNETKCSEVDNIINYSICIVILFHSAPDRVPDLLGYKSDYLCFPTPLCRALGGDSA